jgi:hypothetical protein
VVFFVDRSLGGKKVPNALRAAGAAVETHDSHFRQDLPDQDWLTEAGQRGWIVLTADKHIRYRQFERDALIAAKVQAFVVTARPGPETAGLLVSALSQMLALCEEHKGRPFIAKVSRGPVVEIVVLG